MPNYGSDCFDEVIVDRLPRFDLSKTFEAAAFCKQLQEAEIKVLRLAYKTFPGQTVLPETMKFTVSNEGYYDEFENLVVTFSFEVKETLEEKEKREQTAVKRKLSAEKTAKTRKDKKREKLLQELKDDPELLNQIKKSLDTKISK